MWAGTRHLVQIGGSAHTTIGTCWPSGTCPHEAPWRWKWADIDWSSSGSKTESLDPRLRKREVGTDPQRRPSASPSARFEERREKTRWTERKSRNVKEPNFEVWNCHIWYPAYPVDAVGVADSRDRFGLRVGLLDGSGAERRAAGAHAAVCATALLVLIRRASWLDLQASPLHGVVDAAGKFPIATATILHHRDGKRSAVFPIPATMTWYERLPGDG